tara:strand:- start:32 stop:553 length:522 start_codon:yes stop_codon:yes gene_type:complete
MSSELRVDKIIPTTGVPTGGGGGIIQVVQGTFGNSFSTTSTSLVDQGLTATITPKFSTSKIIATACFTLRAARDSTTQIGAGFALIRTVSGGSAVSLSAGATGTNDDNITYMTSVSSGTLNFGMPISYKALDSPNTTSATVYKLQVSAFGGGTLHAPHGSGIMTRLILEEVSA